MEKNYKEAMEFLVGAFSSGKFTKEKPANKTKLEKRIEQWGYVDKITPDGNGGGVNLRMLLGKMKEEYGIEVGNIQNEGYYTLTQPGHYDKEWTGQIKRAWGAMKRAERIRQSKLRVIGKDVQFTPDKKVDEAYRKFVNGILGISAPDLDEIIRDLDL